MRKEDFRNLKEKILDKTPALFGGLSGGIFGGIAAQVFSTQGTLSNVMLTGSGIIIAGVAGYTAGEYAQDKAIEKEERQRQRDLSDNVVDLFSESRKLQAHRAEVQRDDNSRVL